MRILYGIGALFSVLLVAAACAMIEQPADGQQSFPAFNLPESDLSIPVSPSFASSIPQMLRNDDERRYELHWVDTNLGAPVPGSNPLMLGNSIFVPPEPVSVDGISMAAIESNGQICEPYAGGTACRASADVLHLVDLRARREVTVNLKRKGWAGPLSFSPDATEVALVQHGTLSSTLAIYAMDTGILVAERSLEFRPTKLVYVLDGAALAAYGQPLGTTPGMTKPPSPMVTLVDAGTLDLLWQESLDEIASGEWCLMQCSAPHAEQQFTEMKPAVVPAHDGRALYIAHAGEARLTKVEFDTRKVHSIEIQVAVTWLERLLAMTARVAKAKGAINSMSNVGALSTDGNLFYIANQRMNPTYDAAGAWQGMETSIELQLLDVANGRMLAKRRLDLSEPWIWLEEMSFLPDESTLALNGMDMTDGRMWSELFDATNLEQKARLDWWIAIAQRMDGHPVMAASRRTGAMLRNTELAVLDVQTFDVVNSWTVDTYAAWITP